MTSIKALALAAALLAGAPGYDPAYRPLASASRLQDKSFYLLTVLQADPALRRAVAQAPELATEARRRRAAVEAAQRTCAGTVPCELAPFRYDAAAADALGAALVEALRRTDGLSALARHLRASGRFARHAGLDDATLVRAAWSDAAAGIDRIVRVYGLGEAPLYPKIDSMSYSPTDKMWTDSVGDLVDVQLDAPATGELFFDQPLTAALQLLDMNDRDEPARLEPLARGENAAAFAYARTLDWKRWTYPAMLIPGRSPEMKDDPLSPEAKQKMRLAQRRFAEGLAPLIVVSGGYVNPSQTRFAEALEMKKRLLELGVPERAIVVDPYARHTTTNLRNTARLLIEMGAPLDRPILVTTTAYQSRYIEDPDFRARCLRELKYACFEDLHRLSLFDTTVRLPAVSLHRSADDPLDP